MLLTPSEASASTAAAATKPRKKDGLPKAQIALATLGRPAGRTARALALGKLVAAPAAHHYDQKKVGTAFWQPIAAEYAWLATASGEMRGTASAAEGQKNALEAPLRAVLGSLVLSIRANYPDEGAQRGVLRACGFQKDVY